MKNWFSSLLSSRGKNDLSGDNLPWLDTPSIYEHISRFVDLSTGRLAEAGFELPDEDRFFQGVELRWAPGAVDGTMAFYLEPDETSATVNTLLDFIQQIEAANSLQAKVGLYKLLLKDKVLHYIDEVLPALVQPEATSSPALLSFARFLAKNAPDRGPVKFAIALLGVLGDESDASLVAFLGLHDELTLFAAVALTHLLEDPEPALWDLARKVEGWGRIQVVLRLAETTSPQIQGWLLREGFRNWVMDEYLAYTCAVHGNLRGALASPEVDGELLEAAGEIIQALILGGPAEDISDYQDAAVVVGRYLELLEDRASTLQQYLITDFILGYLTEDWDDDANTAIGWTPENRDQAIQRANRILEKPLWRQVVRQALETAGDEDIHQALRAADLLGIDTWEKVWERLQQNPLEGHCWSMVMDRANADRIDRIVDLAVRSLPLEQIASGPAQALGMGPAYKAHHCLDFIVQGLKPFTGKGWPLLAASLKSPVVRNRNMALNALDEWDRSGWPAQARAALQEAARVETDKEIQQRLETLLGDLDAPALGNQ